MRGYLAFFRNNIISSHAYPNPRVCLTQSRNCSQAVFGWSTPGVAVYAELAYWLMYANGMRAWPAATGLLQAQSVPQLLRTIK